MAKYTYEDLIDDKVQFLQGTQANLNKFFADGSVTAQRGTAIEGAFYLTTDTHKLYIGRKVATGTYADKVFPEEISAGISIVANETELGVAAANANLGDFYYIDDKNALAVLVEEQENGTTIRRWKQINSPTGIGSFQISTAAISSPTISYSDTASYVKIQTKIKPDGSSTDTIASYWLEAGSNITLQPGTSTSAGYGIKISSKNSQSTLMVSTATMGATASQGTTGIPIILHDSDNADSQIFFKGINLTTVESDGNNTVTVAGPKIEGIWAKARGTAGGSGDTHGFELITRVSNGNVANSTTQISVTSGSNSSLLQPIIKYGATASNEAKFYGSQAILNVYSTTETQAVINDAIAHELQVADALHYKGLITFTTGTTVNDWISAHTFSIGDVWKAGEEFEYPSGTDIHIGDLLIAKSTDDTEQADGTIANNKLAFDIVPSGNEPLLEGKISTSSVSFWLEDKNNGSAYNKTTNPSKRPLKVTFDNTNKNSYLIEAVGTQGNDATNSNPASDYVITLKHLQPQTGTYATVTAVSSIAVTTAVWANDTIQKSGITFKALTGIKKDTYGHVLSVEGQDVTLLHNYISKILVTPSSTTSNQGRFNLGLQDIYGLTNEKLTAANKGDFYLFSDTLKFSSTTATGLNINIVWGSF